jgi:hypothetical protein
MWGIATSILAATCRWLSDLAIIMRRDATPMRLRWQGNDI